MGLISKIVDPGEQLSAALATARRMALIDPMLMRETKKALNRT